MIDYKVINMEIGKKIREIRQMNMLTQQELADRCELSKGYISQLERDLTSPSIATLINILQCLGTDFKEFFYDASDTQVVFREEDFFESENDKLKHKVKWIVPNSQKNAMEPIIMELPQGGMSVEESPHSGEEFGYVLEGIIELKLGSKKYRAKKGESFYYEAVSNHSIRNVGKKRALILWVASPPNF